jgi:hypothetical protein
MPYRSQPPNPASKRRGLQECFACHTQVLPNARRECPACGKSVDEVRDDGRRSLTLPDDPELPGYCARCGDPTERRVELRPSRVDERAGGHSVAFRIALAFLSLRAALRAEPQKHDALLVKLPLCDGCEPITPDHVDFDRRELTLVVHRNLRDALLGA